MQATGPNPAKIKPSKLDTPFADLKVTEIRTIIEYQKTVQGKQEIGTKKELIIEEPEGGYKYIMSFSLLPDDTRKAGRVSIYFKDDNEFEQFRNSHLSKTQLGYQYQNETKK